MTQPEPAWIALANDIRLVDGNHDLGAGELAERLIQLGWAKPGDEALRTALTALDRILNDAESKHPGGWGPDVTTVKDLRDARDAVALGLEHG